MKILCVDDSESLRTQLKNDLEGAGFTVVEAEDGVDGIDKLDKNDDVKLIICDVNMPNMDGLTMISKIQDRVKEKNIIVFMLTTETTLEMKTEAKKYGVRAWITKPYAAEKLIFAVKKVTA